LAQARDTDATPAPNPAPPAMPPKSGVPIKGRGGHVLVQESEAWKQQLGTENRIIRPTTLRETKDLGPTGLTQPNTYLGMFQKDDTKTHKCDDAGQLRFTLDKIQDETEYDPKVKEDTIRPSHERHKKGLKSSRAITSSQTYGWYAPIDMPKYGYERSAICQDSFMDHSHLATKDNH